MLAKIDFSARLQCVHAALELHAREVRCLPLFLIEGDITQVKCPLTHQELEATQNAEINTYIPSHTSLTLRRLPSPITLWTRSNWFRSISGLDRQGAIWRVQRFAVASASPGQHHQEMGTGNESTTYAVVLLIGLSSGLAFLALIATTAALPVR